MAEKHEFDVRTLRQGSRSSEAARPNLPPDTHGNDLAVSPPAYSVRDECPPCCPGNIWITDNPTNTELTTTTNIHDPEVIPQTPGREEDYNIVNVTCRTSKQLPDNKITARRNRRGFRSEIQQSPDKIPELTTTQTSIPRRYISRTFPADSSTHPYLDQCYDIPYGYTPSTVPSFPEEGEGTESTRELCMKLAHRDNQIMSLKSAIKPAEREFDSLSALLPRNDDDDPQFDILLMNEREVMAYQRIQWLQDQLTIIWQEILTKEREQKRDLTELLRRSQARDRIEQPLLSMAREMDERNVGRKWLQGLMPWAAAVNIGSDVPDFAMIVNRDR